MRSTWPQSWAPTLCATRPWALNQAEPLLPLAGMFIGFRVLFSKYCLRLFHVSPTLALNPWLPQRGGRGQRDCRHNPEASSAKGKSRSGAPGDALIAAGRPPLSMESALLGGGGGPFRRGFSPPIFTWTLCPKVTIVSACGAQRTGVDLGADKLSSPFYLSRWAKQEGLMTARMG